MPDNPYDFPGINVKWGQAAGGSLSGTYPNPVIGAAFAAYTPVVTAAAGTFTTVSSTGRYKLLASAKLTFIEIKIEITTNGTASGSISITLPNTSASFIPQVLPGREYQSVGKMLQGIIPPSTAVMSIINYDNTYPGADGYKLVIIGWYENA